MMDNKLLLLGQESTVLVVIHGGELEMYNFQNNLDRRLV